MIQRSSFWPTAIAVLAFGIAMGYLEAAVVVYLRSAIEAGAVAPAHDPTTFGTFEAVEIAREVATLVMIAAVGWLAGRTRLERLAWAAVVFGAWDIVYYIGLRVAIGWPPSLDTWDVLFLVPMPWVGPVWAPIVVSAALVVVGMAAARRLRMGRPVDVGPVQAVIAALAGGGLVILSFLVDTNRVAAGQSAAWTGWPLFWAGMALATAATLAALIGRSTAATPLAAAVQLGSEGRPPVGTPLRPSCRRTRRPRFRWPGRNGWDRTAVPVAIDRGRGLTAHVADLRWTRVTRWREPQFEVPRYHAALTPDRGNPRAPSRTWLLSPAQLCARRGGPRCNQSRA